WKPSLRRSVLTSGFGIGSVVWFRNNAGPAALTSPTRTDAAVVARGRTMLKVEVYRYNPETDKAPYMKTYQVDTQGKDLMVLDVLEMLKAKDPSLAYRRSCREGVCGSDGMNISGKNRLACVTAVSDALDSAGRLIIRPLPGMPVVRDLVVDQSLFFKQYERIKPWLINDQPAPSIERLQSPEERAKLDGLYECILCGCCSSQCPSWW